jgi:hypothetical protein
MGNYSSTQSAFSGDGKIHGGSITMVEFHRFDYERIVKNLEKMATKMEIRKAINSAAKQAANVGISHIINRIAEETTLPKSEIKKRIKRYAYGSPLSMSIGIRISDHARPLADFAHTPAKPKYRTAPTVEIYKGKKTTYDKGAFVTSVKRAGNTGTHAGHIGIFERERDKSGVLVKRKMKDIRGNEIASSKEKIHIQQLFGPSITGIFKANKSIHQRIWDILFTNFQMHVEKELGVALNG